MSQELSKIERYADIVRDAILSTTARGLEMRGWREWYTEIFGQEFIDALDSEETTDAHHSEAIEWHWKARTMLLRGQRPPNDYFAYFPIWARGNLKTTIARRIMVCDACLSTTAGVGGYSLIVGGTKKKVGRTASSIEALLHSPKVRQYYPELSEVKRGILGASKGWRADLLNTKAGYVFDFAGLDQGMAGANEEDIRPTFIVPDDIDQRTDSPAIAETNFSTFTSEVLPMRQSNTLVFFAQNLISRFSVMYRIQTQRDRVLTNRKPTMPVPAVRNLETEMRTVNGIGKDLFVSGAITWRGWNAQRVQDEIDTYGLPAFLRECQHEVEADREGRVIPEYEDSPGLRTHIITWSQFYEMFGLRRIPAIWQCELGLDIGYTEEHLTAWSFVATSAQNTKLPNKKFRYRGLTYTAPLLDEMAEDVKSRLWPGEKIIKERISHEKKGERLTLNQKHAFHFRSCRSGKMDGIPQWRHYLRSDRTKPHPFHEDRVMPSGLYLLGEPSWFDVVDDDQFDAPVNDAGLKTHREQTTAWLFVPTPLTDTGMRQAVPVKAYEDTNDSTRMITAEWGPGMALMSQDERIESKMLPGVRKVDIPLISSPEEQAQAITSNRIWTEHFIKEEEEAQKQGNSRVTFRK